MHGFGYDGLTSFENQSEAKRICLRQQETVATRAATGSSGTTRTATGSSGATRTRTRPSESRVLDIVLHSDPGLADRVMDVLLESYPSPHYPHPRHISPRIIRVHLGVFHAALLYPFCKVITEAFHLCQAHPVLTYESTIELKTDSSEPFTVCERTYELYM